MQNRVVDQIDKHRVRLIQVREPTKYIRRWHPIVIDRAERDHRSAIGLPFVRSHTLHVHRDFGLRPVETFRVGLEPHGDRSRVRLHPGGNYESVFSGGNPGIHPVREARLRLRPLVSFTTGTTPIVGVASAGKKGGDQLHRDANAVLVPRETVLEDRCVGRVGCRRAASECQQAGPDATSKSWPALPLGPSESMLRRAVPKRPLELWTKRGSVVEPREYCIAPEGPLGACNVSEVLDVARSIASRCWSHPCCGAPRTI